MGADTINIKLTYKKKYQDILVLLIDGSEIFLQEEDVIIMHILRKTNVYAYSYGAYLSGLLYAKVDITMLKSFINTFNLERIDYIVVKNSEVIAGRRYKENRYLEVLKSISKSKGAEIKPIVDSNYYRTQQQLDHVDEEYHKNIEYLLTRNRGFNADYHSRYDNNGTTPTPYGFGVDCNPCLKHNKSGCKSDGKAWCPQYLGRYVD